MALCLIAGLLLTAGIQGAGPAERASVRSVVKADTRSGKLVRQMAVVPGSGSTRKAALAELGLSREDIDALAARLASEHAIDALLVQAVIRAESGYDPFAVSVKGAQGLMQLMPRTAHGLAVKNSFNPVENIQAGVRHLKALLQRYRGDVKSALAAYNAGAGAVERHNGIPPYPETIAYVAKVDRTWSEARKQAARSESGATAQKSPPRIEQFVDANGTIHLRTVSAP